MLDVIGLVNIFPVTFGAQDSTDGNIIGGTSTYVAGSCATFLEVHWVDGSIVSIS